jgi:hypothetical protein
MTQAMLILLWATDPMLVMTSVSLCLWMMGSRI